MKKSAIILNAPSPFQAVVPATVHSSSKPASPPLPQNHAHKKVYLHPGQLYASGESALVTTILGSCVALCIWDPTNRIGGINHFLLPVGGSDMLRSPRFGTVAIPDLIKKILQLGANPKMLHAKVFGGANVIEAFRDRENHLGTQNVRIARELLQAEAIPIVSEDVGGQRGRKLIFCTDDGSAWVKEL